MNKKLKYKVFICIFAVFILFVSPLFPSSSFTAKGMDELPMELGKLDISDRFIQTASIEAGAINQITGTGNVVAVHRGTKEAYYARAGNPVYENDALYTLTDCRSRVEFKNKDVVIMAPDTHLDIDQVYNSIRKGEKRSLLSMPKGKAIFYALRLLRYNKMTFQLKTSTANIGVRGTKFGTEIEEVGAGRGTLVDHMLASRSLESVQTEKKRDNIITRVYVFEGEIEITSPLDGTMKVLRQNEILEADHRGLGETRFDPETTKRFFEDVMSGMDGKPKTGSHRLDDRFHREQMERTEKMIDIRQREIGTEIRHDRELGRSDPEH